MEALRYKELDKWSLVSDYKEFIDQMKGTFVGHGINLGLDNLQNARIAIVIPDPPICSRS